MTEIKIKLTSKNASVPTYGTKYSAGVDLTSAVDVTVHAGERELISTGISLEMPEGTYGHIFPRSGLALKKSIDIGGGVIDCDYRGEVGVIVVNNGDKDHEIKVGDKIAQMIFMQYNIAKFTVVDDLSATVRGAGGFGSTDDKKSA